MEIYWARKAAEDLVEASKTRETYRRRLLRFLADHKEDIKDPWIASKARRGYLRDLKDFQILITIKEIEEPIK
jgi:hypothetical protein